MASCHARSSWGGTVPPFLGAFVSCQISLAAPPGREPMVLIVVMHHGVGTWSEHGARRAEEAAFWTFCALVERLRRSFGAAAPTSRRTKSKRV